MKRKVMGALYGLKQELVYLRYHRKYSYPNIFIACCPKTASTWLANLLGNLLPGYRYHQSRVLARNQHGSSYNISEAFLQELNRKLTVTRSHTPPTPANIKALDRFFRRYIVQIRDPRDVIVSVFYHIRNKPDSAFLDHGNNRELPWTPLSPAILQLSRERCLDYLIDHMLPELVTLSQGWAEVGRQTENALLVRYEDVTSETFAEICRVLDFFHVSLPSHTIQSTIDAVQKRAHQEGAFLFRRGKKGGWLEELTPVQQMRCQEIAYEFMQSNGYELIHKVKG